MKMLTKSEFLMGLECPRKLWLARNKPELMRPPTQGDLVRMQEGQRVGELAREMFPLGVFPAQAVAGRAIEFGATESQSPAKLTQIAMDSSAHAIFEATFEADHCTARCDILVREGDRWSLLEVKAGSKPEKYLEDLAFQYWVARQKHEVGRAKLVLINPDYARDDGNAINPHEFLTIHDLTEEIIEHTIQIAQDVDKQLFVLNPENSEPIVKQHSACKACGFRDHCASEWDADDIYPYFSRSPAKLRTLREADVHSVRDVPEVFKLTGRQQIMVRSVQTCEEFVSDHLESWFSSLKFPIHCIDFEAIAPGVPIFPGTKANQRLACQWSDHVITDLGIEWDDELLYHVDFIHKDLSDPRERFATSLYLQLNQDSGSILHYSPYELVTIQQMVRDEIPLAKNLLECIQDRAVDLLKVLEEHYYHPKQRASYSIKTMIEVFGATKKYKDLPISDGQIAAAEYLRALRTAGPEREEIFANLREYCRLDTEAMARIIFGLYQRSQARS